MKHVVACVQALWGTRAVGQEKEGELATTSLEFEYLHQKGRYKMLIGVDDTILITSLPLVPFFSMFVYIRTLFRFVLIGGNLTAQFTGSHSGIHGGIQIPSPSSSSPATRASW